MKKFSISLLLSCLTGAAYAHGCPGEMKAIDAKLASSPKLSESDMAKVNSEPTVKAGNHGESMKILAEAKKTLGL
jgi:hypothetical protein